MKELKTGITTPKGFEAAGEHIGIKNKKKDLAIIFSKTPALCSAVFTQNLVKAPPLAFCQETLADGNKIQAIIINSGNANACTGKQGYKDAVETVAELAKSLNISEKSILVTSTGVIGVFLPMETMIKGIKPTASKLSSSRKSATDCAEAIMTTDTFVKEVSVEIDIDGTPVTISGIAKGSGMIHPNMATMLGFLTTDANITQELLDKAFKTAIFSSFNMISVDGETSTNDMAVILANGEAKNQTIDSENENYKKFAQAVDFVCKELAKKIVLDGEGASKFLEVHIDGAKTDDDAKILCKSIINSNLVKTAFFGQDANWGRIISAMGASGASFDPNKVKIRFENKIGDVLLYENGLPVDFDEDFALKILKEKQINLLVEMQEGNSSIIGWGCDLSYDYVKINASYRT